MHRAKPIPLWMSATKGSPSGRAPAIAGERVIVAIIRPLRRLRRHLKVNWRGTAREAGLGHSQRARLWFVENIANDPKTWER